MDKKIFQRLLTFFVIFPAIIALTFWDFLHHLPLVILAVGASVMGALEMAAMLRNKGMEANHYLPVLFGLAFPVAAYLEVCGLIQPHHTLVIIVLFIMLVFTRQIFANTEEGLQPVLGKVAGNLLILIYPGLFLYFFIKILSFEQSAILVSVFAVAIYGNDANAWLFGNLFGRNSSKPFLVSPKKSTVGFIGGILGTYLVIIVSFFWFPGLLGNNLFIVIGLATLLAFSTIVGDLFESSLKRSAGVKDSGGLIPGRGGILDSMDSVIFSAPLFYIFLMYGRI